MEKDQIIKLKIDDMLDDGRAFGRYEGCAVFVSGGAVPGDNISARVVKAKKSAAEAVLEDLISPSADRITAECPYAGECGGCSMQELSYEAQKRIKTAQVISKLQRLGGIEAPKVNEIIEADTLKYYRNKAVFAVGPNGEVGFKRGKSHHVIDIDDCMLQSDAAMVCADALRQFLRETGVNCISQMTVKTAFGTGEVMVVLEKSEGKQDAGSVSAQRNGKKRGRGNTRNAAGGRGSESAEIPQIEKLAELLDDAVYSLNADAEKAGIQSPDAAEREYINDVRYSLESIAVIHQGKCRIVAGTPTITDIVTRGDGKEFRFEIAPQSFYQVNPEQMVKLYDKAMEYAFGENTGSEACGEDGYAAGTLLDLYCGVGTIGIWMADKAERVIGIESVKPAVIDANRNSVINGLINTRYICGKAEEELPGMMGLAKLYKWNEVNERVEREPEIRIESADVAVLDPPRAGCGEALLAAVATASPGRIVYVSCDPGTLARDIRFLEQHGYEFIECTPVDQFPWTTHIETVCLLSKGEISSKNVRIEFPMEEMDMSGFQFGATYEEIQNWVQKEYGFKVPTLYIAQIKRKCGLDIRDHYNIS
ncbi:MAG: class I SAM-dependent RNA methyltransferase, partial [Mogibacterium sp.]|nr:class I SAM-dependent RNA methyltransferase [Mogibacterium sp.]